MRVFIVTVVSARQVMRVMRAFTHFQNAQAWKNNNHEHYARVDIVEVELEGE